MNARRTRPSCGSALDQAPGPGYRAHAGALHRLVRPGGRRPGFTLLETALAMVIVLVGVIAMVEAQQTFIRSNSWSSHEATATYLANELRERMRTLSRHDPVTGLYLAEGPGGGTVLVGLGPEPGEVTVADFDDIDDYHDITFGDGGQFEGPIDAFGRIIPEIDTQGNIRLDAQGKPIPLRGWSQSIEVAKVNPYNFAETVDWKHYEESAGNFPGRAVDQYPLRVTVIIRHLGAFNAEPQEVIRMSWIVPPRMGF